MRKRIGWIALMFTALWMNGCREKLQPSGDKTDTDVTIVCHLPDGMLLSDEYTLTIEATDLNMARHYHWELTGVLDGDSVLVHTVTIPTGYYDWSSSGVFGTAGRLQRIRGYAKGQSTVGTGNVDIRTYLTSNNTDLIIAEVFFAGTLTPEGKQYTGDKYVVLYNNTEDTLFADGIVLVESKMKNTTQITLKPVDFRNEYFAADALYRIPGTGKEHPVAPGGTILLVDNGIDHRSYNPNSFDLSHADFEWYDVSTNPNYTDVNNPDVEDLEKIYCYTLTIWAPNNQGNTSLALCRLPDSISAEDYVARYKFTYDYIIVTKAGTFDMSATACKLMNNWVVDAVNLCPSTTYQWLVVDDSLDGGYTYVATAGNDKSRYGKCVRRRTMTTHPSGRRILQDTNNSTEDFLPTQEADPTYFMR